MNKKIIERLDMLSRELEELRKIIEVEAGGKKNNNKVEAKKNFSGLTGEIFTLVQEGFFKEPKTIVELQNKLRLEGIRKPTSSLMKPLLLLVRKKIIGRNKSGKEIFRYYKR